VPPSEGIRTPWRSIAVVLLAGVLGFWYLQWQSAPAPGLAATQASEAGDDD
jgi:hypothetical protein